jgi:hypothetical protein
MTDQPVSFAPTPEISVTETISYQTLQWELVYHRTSWTYKLKI